MHKDEAVSPCEPNVRQAMLILDIYMYAGNHYTEMEGEKTEFDTRFLSFCRQQMGICATALHLFPEAW